ncbi:hypothetical protein F4777DRAFT_582625 [Nemania sp. FL0916]|nr:hypothetical protein F4777DRAFT_582625 [Nemania sp. FL0916]
MSGNRQTPLPLPAYQLQEFYRAAARVEEGRPAFLGRSRTAAPWGRKAEWIFWGMFFGVPAIVLAILVVILVFVVLMWYEQQDWLPALHRSIGRS